MTSGSSGIFITHSRHDSVVAGQVAEALTKRGKDVFSDLEMLPGSSWVEDLNARISSAEAAIVLLTPALFGSHFASRELGALLRRCESEPDFLVLPVLLEDTEPPGFLKGRRYIDGRKKPPSEVANEIADALGGPLPDAPRFQPTGPGEYLDRLRAIRQTAEREDLLAEQATKATR